METCPAGNRTEMILCIDPVTSIPLASAPAAVPLLLLCSPIDSNRAPIGLLVWWHQSGNRIESEIGQSGFVPIGQPSADRTRTQSGSGANRAIHDCTMCCGSVAIADAVDCWIDILVGLGRVPRDVWHRRLSRNQAVGQLHCWTAIH